MWQNLGLAETSTVETGEHQHYPETSSGESLHLADRCGESRHQCQLALELNRGSTSSVDPGWEHELDFPGVGFLARRSVWG